MAMKAEIVSRDTIKPSSPTPDHLRHFKLSLLDQLAPPFYVPILLFYSASDATAFGTEFKTISNRLKASLSDVLTLYYPFCGRLRGNSTVECSDEGVLYTESKVPMELSNILESPHLQEINELFPCDPYKPERETLGNMAVQLNQFRCGGVALGVCFSHKIADASTAASFLNAWVATSRGQEGNNELVPPRMEDAALLFPQRNIQMDVTRGMVGHKNIVTKRFVFNETNIYRLRQKLGCFNFNPTRVEAVTALIWKSSLEAAKASSGDRKFPASMISHAVNIRSRMASTLSKHWIGNLWQQAVSPLVEVEGEVELRNLAERVRETVRKVDGNYVSKLQSDEFFKVIESLKETRIMASEKGIPCYSFSSWIRFGFYEADFGWGKPTYVRTVGVPIKNVVILMGTKIGDGIEAWVTLTTCDMLQFEQNPELLEFASFDS
ncbi:Vinorine synthase [Spatholobus suberectus]|nr:Vinorine synthase [Spatholobus suberectus]